MTTAMHKTRRLILAVASCALTGCTTSTSGEITEKTQFVEVDSSLNVVKFAKYASKSTPLFNSVDVTTFNKNFQFKDINHNPHKVNIYANGDYSYTVDGNDALGHHDIKEGLYFVTNTNSNGFFYDEKTGPEGKAQYEKFQSYANSVIKDDYDFCHEVYKKVKSYVTEKDQWSYDSLNVMITDIGDTIGYNTIAKKDYDGKVFEEQTFVTLDKVNGKYYYTDVIVRQKVEDVENEKSYYAAKEIHFDILHENEKLEEIVFSRPNSDIAKGGVNIDDLDFSGIDTPIK